MASALRPSENASNARENGGAAEAESPIARPPAPSRRFGDEYADHEEERVVGRDEEVVRAATATPEVCVRQYFACLPCPSRLPLYVCTNYRYRYISTP